MIKKQYKGMIGKLWVVFYWKAILIEWSKNGENEIHNQFVFFYVTVL